jgi:predicted dithiol-disulfide oxidoreductase (DUF899 family)
VAVSRAPLVEFGAFKKRMGWRFKWVSSYGSDFNYDFHVTSDEAVTPVEYNYRSKAELLQRGEPWFTEGENHGASVFYKDTGRETSFIGYRITTDTTTFPPRIPAAVCARTTRNTRLCGDA